MPAPAKVLIVDDNAANLLALEETLRPLGAEVVRASSGQEALLHLLQNDFAVVLLDVVMPGFDGLETAALIKQREKSRATPIIFLSAVSPAPAAILDAYSRGAVDYLMKPFDPHVLRAKVAVFLELHLKNEAIKRQAAALAEAMPPIFWELSASGAFEYLSPRWFEYTGDHAARSTVARAFELMHADDRARAEERWREASGAGAVWEVECRLQRKGGDYRWHRLRSVPSPDARGAIRWYGTATDIDDQKRAEAEGAALYEKAQRAVKSRDELLAMVSHDLRNPLETIFMSADLIADENQNGPRSPRLAKQIGMIGRAARRMEHLIRDLLDIASIENGRLSIAPEPTTVGPLIAEAVETAAAGARDKQVRIETDLDDVHATVCADRARVLQVFANIIGNAIKFTPAGGRVVLAARKGDGAITFSIADTGSGIPASELPYVFDRFWQAKEHARAGAGLGLAICDGIVRSHAGKIWVESQPGAGTTFSFTLPLAAG